MNITGTADTTDAAEARLALRALVATAWQAQCLAAAADLGLPERLAAGAASTAELAAACGVHEPSLGRLLAALTAVGVVDAGQDGQYTLTPLGRALDQLGPWVRYTCSGPSWSAWAELSYAVRTGEPAFARVHGMPPWDYYATRPEAGARFQASMAAITAGVAAAITASYDFSPFGLVADIGGGDGTLLAQILTASPAIRGVLADLPPVLDRARPVLAAAGVSDRCDLAGGNFMNRVPAADLYLLKSVLHDWEDDAAAAILERCADAARPGAHLVIAERVLPERPGPADLEAVLADLNMMVLLGGRERTRPQYRRLLKGAGFRLSRVVATGTEYSLLDAVLDD